MKITIFELWSYYSMKFQYYFYVETLKNVNEKLEEGGVVDWTLLNFLWESDHGTIEGMKRELDRFKVFVDARFKLMTEKSN